MISIIIPTLWKSDKIYKTIESFLLYNNKENSEIIIIDNLNSDYKSPDLNYIRVEKMQENIFVNPSWNLGAKLARNNHICLLNDDIFINIHTLLENFKRLVYDVNLDYGMIPIQPKEFKFYEIPNNDNDLFFLDKVKTRGSGFGMMMIMKKENYYDIPDCFKIYFGDDILWYINDNLLKNKNLYFKNLKVTGSLSVTSSEFESQYLQQESIYWDEEIRKIIDKYANN